jgi:hypothetical protein
MVHFSLWSIHLKIYRVDLEKLYRKIYLFASNTKNYDGTSGGAARLEKFNLFASAAASKLSGLLYQHHFFRGALALAIAVDLQAG